MYNIVETQVSIGRIQCFIDQTYDDYDPNDQQLAAHHHNELSDTFDEEYQQYADDYQEMLGEDEDFDRSNPKIFNEFFQEKLFDLRLDTTIAIAKLLAVLKAHNSNLNRNPFSLCEKFPRHNNAELLSALHDYTKHSLSDLSDKMCDQLANIKGSASLIVSDELEQEAWDNIQYCRIITSDPSHPEHKKLCSDTDFFAPETIAETVTKIKYEIEFIAGYLFQSDDYAGNSDLVETINSLALMTELIGNYVEELFPQMDGQNIADSNHQIDIKYGDLRVH